MTQEQLKSIQEKWDWWMTFPQRSGDPAWVEAKRDIDELLTEVELLGSIVGRRK